MEIWYIWRYCIYVYTVWRGLDGWIQYIIYEHTCGVRVYTSAHHKNCIRAYSLVRIYSITRTPLYDYTVIYYRLYAYNDNLMYLKLSLALTRTRGPEGPEGYSCVDFYS